MRLGRLLPWGAVAGAVTVIVAFQAPADSSAAALSESFTVAPAERPVVCPGPVQVPVGDVGGAEGLGSGSSETLLQILPDSPEAIGEGTVVDAPAATQVEWVADGDVASLAGLNCTVAYRDQWLVGGATSLGASARLVLSNPSAAAVRARVSLHGPLGLVGVPSEINVPAGGQVSQVLEGIEAELSSLAVRVEAGGAGVSAALQDSRLEGFVPAGTDWVSATPLTGTHLTVPVAGDSTSSRPAVLRVVAIDDAQVRVSLVGEDGAEPWLGDQVIDIAAGQVRDLPLPDVSVSTVMVDATAEVVAASMVHLERTWEDPDSGVLAADLAWSAGVTNTEDGPLTVVVPEGEVELLAYSSREQSLDAAGVDIGLAADAVTVTALDLPAGSVLTLDTDAVWLLRVTADPGFITTLSPQPVDRVALDVTVAVGTHSAV